MVDGRKGSGLEGKGHRDQNTFFFLNFLLIFISIILFYFIFPSGLLQFRYIRDVPCAHEVSTTLIE